MSGWLDGKRTIPKTNCAGQFSTGALFYIGKFFSEPGGGVLINRFGRSGFSPKLTSKTSFSFALVT
jgi:hypothetical protein